MNSRRTRYRIRRGKVKNSRLLPALQTETDCSRLCTTGTKSDEQPDRQLHDVQERIRRAGFRPDYRWAIPRIKVLLAKARFTPWLNSSLERVFIGRKRDRRSNHFLSS